MKYNFSSKLNVEAENTVEAWDKFLDYFILDLGMDFASVNRLGKVYEIKEGKMKKPMENSKKFKKPFDFRSKWKWDVFVDLSYE